MLIGEVAREYRIPVDTLRYYDRIGLLCPERKGKQRHYSAEDLMRLDNIIRLRALMFSLEEISYLLSLDEQVERDLRQNTIDREKVQALWAGVSAKHAEVLKREQDLQRVRAHLEQLLEKIRGAMNEA